MTEQQYLIEMLCCTPKEMLKARLSGKKEFSEWLSKISKENVEEAIRLYDSPKYKQLREKMEKTL